MFNISLVESRNRNSAQHFGKKSNKLILEADPAVLPHIFQTILIDSTFRQYGF